MDKTVQDNSPKTIPERVAALETLVPEILSRVKRLEWILIGVCATIIHMLIELLLRTENLKFLLGT